MSLFFFAGGFPPFLVLACAKTVPEETFTQSTRVLDSLFGGVGRAILYVESR